MGRLRNGLLVEEGVKESDSLLDLIEDQRLVDDTTPTRAIAPRRRAWPDLLIARMDDPSRHGIRPRRNIARPPGRLAHPRRRRRRPLGRALCWGGRRDDVAERFPGRLRRLSPHDLGKVGALS